MLLIIEEAKETVLDFSQGTVKVCEYNFIESNSIEWFNFYQYKMMQYNSLNVKLSDSQLNKLKSAIKKKAEVVLRLSSSTVDDDETNFPHKLLLANRQLQIFVKLLLTNCQLILSYQKLKYLRWYNQEDFLVDCLVHY